MAPRHRRTRPGPWLLGGLTAGLGMLAGSSVAGALPLDVTTTTVPVPSVSIPAATVPTTAPPVPDPPLVDSGISDLSGIVNGTVDLPVVGEGGSASLGPAAGGGTAGAGGSGGPVTGELTARSDAPAGSDPSGSTTEADGGVSGSGRARAGGAQVPSRDLRTLRRLAVQSAGDFSVPFLLGTLALAFLFFQRRMSMDDPALVAAAAEDDELMRFS